MSKPLQEFLSRLVRREDLTREEATELLEALLEEEATDAQIAGALSALTTKGETIEELAGLAFGLRSRAVVPSREQLQRYQWIVLQLQQKFPASTWKDLGWLGKSAQRQPIVRLSPIRSLELRKQSCRQIA